MDVNKSALIYSYDLIFLGEAFQEMFGEEIKKITISPQLTLVVSQYLTTNIEPFKVQFMSEIVLKRLLAMNVYREIKIKKDSEGNQQKQEEKELIIMTKGKPIDYFVLIIEGKLLTLTLRCLINEWARLAVAMFSS